ncbi:MAG: hypothetical protein J6A42_05060 [Firmicutes bacterium]|nr:hypothetical protein [Bacillota bacterium]
MKRHALSKRIISILLALLMTASVTLTASADTMTIDSSGFTDPTITKGTVYYWHKGMPPATVDGTSYPVLMVWDDKYYLAADSSFYSELVGTNKTKHAEALVDKVTDVDDPMDVDWDYEKPYLPAGFYHKDREYSGHSVSELPFDFNVLKKTGTVVSFGAPNLPRFVAVDQEQSSMGNQIYNNKVDDLDLEYKTEASYAIWFPNPDTGSTVGENKYWLMSTHRIYSRYDEMDTTFGTKARYVNSLDWYLDFMRTTQAKFTDPETTFTPAHNGLNSRGHEARPKPIDLNSRTWRVARIQNSEKYHIYGNSAPDAHLTSFYPDNGRNNLKHYVEIMRNTNQSTALMHVGSKLMSVGEGGGVVAYSWLNTSAVFNPVRMIEILAQGGIFSKDGRYEDREDFQNAQAGFDLYWGEPATISFCQLDFTVQKGQVQTMDGPIAIGHDVTITVEDGGVLSCSDWIINNGTIVVKPGGTLLLQTYETANEQIRYGTVASVHDASGDDGGRIYCDGTIIVMPDCKLCCSGKYGLRLGEGAQVVNYGAIISENISAAQSHTIENRGDSSCVFAGYGLTDCGSTLLTERITGDKYTEKGSREKAAIVNLPRDTVYGKGAARVYKNNAATVTYTSETSSGGVTDNVEKLPPISGGSGETGKKAQYFTLTENDPYTVYYPDTRECISSMRDCDVTFAFYEDTSQESYMYYDYQITAGTNAGDWVNEKKILDVTRPVQVYQGDYYNPDFHVNLGKMIFEGMLYDWDGSDAGYFDPPETEETALVDVKLADDHKIVVNGDTVNYIYLYSKSRILIYENGESVYLGYSYVVGDYYRKNTLKASDTVKIYHCYCPPGKYYVIQDLIYEGLAKDWDPTYILDE